LSTLPRRQRRSPTTGGRRKSIAMSVAKKPVISGEMRSTSPLIGLMAG
jgi:hypothetical protein